jgi:hypothetical protein
MKTMKKNNRGVSITEVVVASAILGGAALSVGYFVVNSKQSATQIGGSSGCVAAAYSIVEHISAFGVRSELTDPFVPTGDRVTPTRLTQAQFLSNYKQSVVDQNTWINANTSTNPIIGTGNNPVINNGHLILGAASALQTLYNSNNGYCDNAKGVALTGLGNLSASFSRLPNAQASLKIEAVNRNTGDVGCAPRPIYTGPTRSGAQPTYPNWGVAHTNYSFKYTVFVDFDKNDGTRASCMAEGSAEHQPDASINDSIFDGTVTITAGTGVTLDAAREYTSCDTDGGNYDNIQLDIGLQNLEGGSVLVCRGRSRSETSNCWSNWAAWRSCEQMYFEPGRLAANAAALSFPAPSNTSQATLSITVNNLDGDKEYQVQVAAVDTAGYLTAASAPIPDVAGWENATATCGAGMNPMPRGFVIDASRPDWGGAVSLNNDNTVVEAAANPPDSSAFAAADPIANLFGTQLYQCNPNGQPAFSGEYPNPLGNERCYATSIDEDSVTRSQSPNPGMPTSIRRHQLGGTCSMQLSNNPAWTDGDVTMTAEIRDICNPPPAVAAPQAVLTQDWIVDYGPWQTAEHDMRTPGNSAPANSYEYPFAETPDKMFASVWAQRQSVNNQGNPMVFEVPTLSGGGTTAQTFDADSDCYNSEVPPFLQMCPDGLSYSLEGVMISTIGGPQLSPCYYGKGFLAKAWGPCGQEKHTVHKYPQLSPPAIDSSPFAIRGEDGETCRQVPCNIGLMCNYFTETCGPRNCSGWRCHNHEDCVVPKSCNTPPPFASTYTPEPFPMYCDPVAGQGRWCDPNFPSDCLTDQGPGVCEWSPGDGRHKCRCPDHRPVGYSTTLGMASARDPVCTDLTYLASPPVGAAPDCTCDQGTANATCVGESFADSCNVADACMGRNTGGACAKPPHLLVNAACTTDTTTGGPLNNGWLGANAQTIVITPSGGVLDTSGAYRIYCCAHPNCQTNPNDPLCLNPPCAADPDHADWRDCTWDSWPESLIANTPDLTYFGMVKDDRDDWFICSGNYRLDRTPPVWTDTPMIGVPAGSANPVPCGAAAEIPTVDTKVNVTNLGLVVGDPAVAGDDVSPEHVECSDDRTGITRMNAVECETTPTWPSPDQFGYPLIVVAKDDAGNETPAAPEVRSYVAVRTGMTHDYVGDSAECKSAPYCMRGCKAATCNNSIYEGWFQNQISGGNALNFAQGMVMHKHSWPVTLDSPSGDSRMVSVPAPWGGPYPVVEIWGALPFPKPCSNCGSDPANLWDSTGYRTWGGAVNWSEPGERHATYAVGDLCGNVSDDIPGQIIYMDWYSPAIIFSSSKNCPPTYSFWAEDVHDSANYEYPAGMAESGVRSVHARCYYSNTYGVGPSASFNWGPGGGSLTPGVELDTNKGNDMVCRIWAVDNAQQNNPALTGNSGLELDGQNAYRTKEVDLDICVPQTSLAAQYCEGLEVPDSCCATIVGTSPRACPDASNHCRGTVYFDNKGGTLVAGGECLCIGTDACPTPTPTPTPTPAGTPSLTPTPTPTPGVVSCGYEAGTIGPDTCVADDPSNLLTCECAIWRCTQNPPGTVLSEDVVNGVLPPTCGGISCSLWRSQNLTTDSINDTCGNNHSGNQVCNEGSFCDPDGLPLRCTTNWNRPNCNTTCDIHCGYCGTSCSFTASMAVWLRDDKGAVFTKSIVDLKAGDKVISYDTENEEISVSVVTQLFPKRYRSFGLMEFDDGGYLEVTHTHPFYLAKEKAWRNAGELKVGEEVFMPLAQTTKKITSITWGYPEQFVYNIEVEPFHNYIVDGVLVHNKPCNDPICNNQLP